MANLFVKLLVIDKAIWVRYQSLDDYEHSRSIHFADILAALHDEFHPSILIEPNTEISTIESVFGPPANIKYFDTINNVWDGTY